MTSATVVAEGLYFGEGPRWHEDRLWFSDFHDRSVQSMDESGRVRTELTIDDQPSGLGWLPDGRMLVVSMRRRQVLRVDPNGVKVHADLSQVATFHTNDMIVDAQGRAYVGNFGFDLDQALRSQGIEGVLAEHPTAALARVDPDGSVHIASRDMHFPNGCVITPDGKTLIVAETLAMQLSAFDIGTDGTLSNRRVWARLGMRAPDGICLDADGHVWIANAIAPECVLFARDGRLLASIETQQPCFACMLGGRDRRTLYMFTAPTAMTEISAASRQGRIVSARVETAGAGWP